MPRTSDQTFSVSLEPIAHPTSAVAAVLAQKTTATGTIDEAPLEAMIRLHGPALARLIHRLSGWQKSDCDDLLQSVFVAVMKNLDRFEAKSALPTWLTAIAINAVRAERRRRFVSAKHWFSIGREKSKSVDAADGPSQVNESRERVIAAVRSLPAKYREVLVLRYLEEMELSDVATALGMKKNAVEVRLHRAKQMLETQLGGI